MAQFIWNSARILCLFRHAYLHDVYGEANIGNPEARSQNFGTSGSAPLLISLTWLMTEAWAPPPTPAAIS